MPTSVVPANQALQHLQEGATAGLGVGYLGEDAYQHVWRVTGTSYAS